MASAQALPCVQEDFYLADWWVQPSLNRLSHGGQAYHLAPRFMQVLQYLAAQPGQVIEREALLCAVWPHTIVEDSALSQAVFHLRKVLGDETRQPRFIETIPKRGYRLLAPVRLPETPPMAAPQRPAPTPVAPPTIGPPVRRVAWPTLAVAGAALVLVALVGKGWMFGEPPPGPAPLHAVPITSYPGVEMDPALSPDGTRLAYAGRPPEAKRFGLFLKTLTAELPLQLTDTDADDVKPAWAPDGQRLAFIRLQDGYCTIMVMPVPGGPARALLPCSIESHPTLAWAPDGQTLAVSDRPGRGQSYRLSLLHLDARTLAPLPIPPPAGVGDRDPAFSPDGRRLAFTRTSANGTAELYTFTLADQTLQQQTRDAARIRGVAWTRHGDGLIFASSRAGSTSMWRLTFGQEAPEWLGSEPGAFYPAVARQGSGMVYAQMRGNTNLWRIASTQHAAADPHPLSPSSTGDRDPQIAPDGTRIVFVSDRSGHAEVWLCDADGANPVQVTSLQGPAPRRPRWAPDGQQLVFEVHQGPTTALYTMPAQGGRLHRLTDGEATALAPSWSPDGRWVYFSIPRHPQGELWRISAQGGTPQALGQRGTMPQAAPQGNSLYYAREDTSGIWRLDLSTGTTKRVICPLSTDDPLNWVVHEAGIYYVKRETAEVRFWHPETGAEETVAPLPPRLAVGRSFSVAPGGQWLVFAQSDVQESDIMHIAHLSD